MIDKSEVRVRFAPSPTGYLHIGGVRTALFNWLFARRHGGKFILRIDDTDQRRNLQEALQPILDGFHWLGIDWDEGPDIGGPYEPYFQSQRSKRHGEAVETLISKGLAYRDYAFPEEFQAERKAAEREKRQFVYSRQWMAKNEADEKRFQEEGRQAVVRLKMPREGQCRFRDMIRGDMSFDWSGEQDHVIQRADGSCLYHLSSVVDDGDFKISHVIRAVEHLPNTPRQIFIAQGLGFELPRFAHLPYVAEPGSANKLSKRKLDKYLKNQDFRKLYEHGSKIAEAIGHTASPDTFNPVIVDFYREVGYLPQAVINYLLLLGWSLDDRTEYFSPEDMIQHFNLERVNKGPASFDPQKMSAFQAHYMRNLSLEDKITLVLPYLEKAGLITEADAPDVIKKVSAIVNAAGDRIVVAGDILDYKDFFVADADLSYDEKAFQKRLQNPEHAARLLLKFRKKLESFPTFEATHIEELMQEFIQDEGIGIGQIIHALRVAVTGKAIGFGMFETLEILGRDRCLSRIDHALNLIES